jgi:hypothetical protein
MPIPVFGRRPQFRRRLLAPSHSLYPVVIPPPVIRKLGFVHMLMRGTVLEHAVKR